MTERKAKEAVFVISIGAVPTVHIDFWPEFLDELIQNQHLVATVVNKDTITMYGSKSKIPHRMVLKEFAINITKDGRNTNLFHFKKDLMMSQDFRTFIKDKE